MLSRQFLWGLAVGAGLALYWNHERYPKIPVFDPLDHKHAGYRKMRR